jgi:hypothetical protein
LASGYNYMTSLGTLAMVHDFAFGVTSSGGFIDSITDRTGNPNTLTAAGAVRPAFNAADVNFNNQPCAQFDGVDDVLRIASATLGGSLGPGFLGVVFRIVANVNGDVVQSYNNASFRHSELTASRVQSNFNPAVIAGTENFVTTTHVLLTTCDGANMTRYVDGALSGAPLPFVGSSASGSPYGLGATSSGGAGWSSVKIALAIVGRSAITAQQADDFATYCSGRFGTP